MAIKRTGQFSFVDALLPQRGANGQLDRLVTLVDWRKIEGVAAHLRDPATAGRPGYPVLVLIKAVVLQALYGLSERELEEAISDRLSFRRFIGLALDETVPDHTVLNRFRNRLVDGNFLVEMFAELDRQLEEAGVILKRGTMMDATLLESSAVRPTDTRPSKDPDARFAKRAGKPGALFGYKAHVGVDEGSGLIRAVITTPANVNDTTPADELIRGDEASALGDAAYHTHARQAALTERGIKPRLMRRPNKHHPDLPDRLKRYNRLIARRRAAVETTFATWKNRMGLVVIRYRGLAKASGQVLLVAFAFNLRRWARLSPA